MLKRLILALDLAAHGNLVGSLQLLLFAGNDPIDFALHAAEVAILHRGIHIVSRLRIDVVGDGLLAAALHRGNVR